MPVALLKSTPSWALLGLYPLAVVVGGVAVGWLVSRVDACIYAALGACLLLALASVGFEVCARWRGWRVTVSRGEVVAYARFAGRWEEIAFDVDPDVARPVIRVGVAADWERLPAWARASRATILARLDAAVGRWCSVVEESGSIGRNQP